MYLTLVVLVTLAFSSSAALAKGKQASGHGSSTSVSGTMVLGGTMSSTATITMTGALSVGHAGNLDWPLPLARSMQLDGYDEQVQSVDFSFNVPPDRYTDVMDAAGHSIRSFHWNAPPADTVISVTETLRVVVGAALSTFQSVAPYPMTASPSPEIAPYLQETTLVQLPPSATTTVKRLAAKRKTEGAVVEAVADWVATNIHYDATRQNGPFDAASVFAGRSATCRGYDDVMLGILRQLGIPARVEYGWVSAQPLTLPGPGGASSSIQWAVPGTQGEPHVWLNVWFPDAGWVPFDPQSEKFFADVRHFAFLTNVDAGDVANDPALDAQASYDPAQVSSPWGPDLAAGGPEILPGDGISSHVTVDSHDNLQVVFRGWRHDVSKGILFAR